MGLPLSAYIHRTILTAPDGTQTEGVNYVAMTVWDPIGLQWIKYTGSGGGGGGGAVTIVDGGDVQAGFTTDAAVYGDVSGTESAKLRGINAMVRGLGTANSPASASVSSTDSIVLAANAARKKMVIFNLGSTNVYFGDGYPAALNSGIVLTPNGTWVMDRYTFTTNAIHAICTTSSQLAIQEYQ